MTRGDIDTESDRVANSFLIFPLSYVILLIILTLTIEAHLWISIIAFSCSFVLTLGYYIRSTLKGAKLKKESPNNQHSFDVDVDGG